MLDRVDILWVAPLLAIPMSMRQTLVTDFELIC
jgi:hypothetical protein